MAGQKVVQMADLLVDLLDKSVCSLVDQRGH